MTIHHLGTRQIVGMREFVAQNLATVPAERHPASDELAEVKAQARVDWGRWIVDCPFCAGAVLLDWGCPLTYCLSCHNEKAGHKWVEVELPTDAERAAVEAALEELPESEQHWRPGQSLDDLAKREPVAELPPAEMLAQLAQTAGEERDRALGLLEATRAAHTEERAGALRLIREIERLRLEASIRKDLNRDLQDQIDALTAHSHEN